jgi:hypothetical protein
MTEGTEKANTEKLSNGGYLGKRVKTRLRNVGV